MEKNQANQVTMSQATGIAVSRINNYLHGKYRTIRPDHLALIANAVGRTAVERGELAKAYVIDLLPEVLLKDVHIQTAAENGKSSKAPFVEKIGIPTQGVRAINRLIDLSSRTAKARERIGFFADLLTDAHPQ
jgi:transcriptional regulator with XRE-family HTH domain